MSKQPKTLEEAMRNPRFFFWPWMTANNINEHGDLIVPAVYPKTQDVCFVEGSIEEIRACNARNAEINAMYVRDLNTVFDYRISRGMPILPSAKY